MSAVLPSVIGEALADPMGFVEGDEASAPGVVAYTCSYVPLPLLSVEGLVPVRLRAPGTASTPLADTYLSTVLCPYVRGLLEAALDGRFGGVGAWVLCASCDHQRRLYDNLRYLLPAEAVHMLDVPHKRGGPAGAFYAEELRQLARALAERLEVDLSADAVLDAALRHEERRALLAELSALRRQDPPRISGGDFHRVLVAAATWPWDRIGPAVGELVERLREAPGVEGARARLMVVGSQLDDPSWIDVVESVGGIVTADRFCFGSTPGLEPLELGDDPFEDLARHALETTRCPRMMEDAGERADDVIAEAREGRAHGVVVETMKFCDLWGVESAGLVPALRRAGLPVLRLEREYAFAGEGQLRTRVQAFVESMGR